jgi:hypothetical protein
MGTTRRWLAHNVGEMLIYELPCKYRDGKQKMYDAFSCIEVELAKGIMVYTLYKGQQAG